MSNKTLDLLEVHQLKCDGNEMSMIVNPENENEYLAIISKKDIYVGYEEPQTQHNIFLVKLDKHFNILSSNLICDPNKKSHGFSESGINNCVLINNEMFMGVVFDTKEEWKLQLCLCHFRDAQIVKMTELDSFGVLNPIILKFNLASIFAIGSYSPFRVVSLNMETGGSQLVHMLKVFNQEDYVITHGTSVYLPEQKEYLVSLRVEQNKRYHYSFWITLTERYKLSGISNPFLFHNRNKRDECCKSLVVRNSNLYASVSMMERILIYEYSLPNVHKSIYKI